MVSLNLDDALPHGSSRTTDSLQPAEQRAKVVSLIHETPDHGHLLAAGPPFNLHPGRLLFRGDSGGLHGRTGARGFRSPAPLAMRRTVKRCPGKQPHGARSKQHSREMAAPGGGN